MMARRRKREVELDLFEIDRIKKIAALPPGTIMEIVNDGRSTGKCTSDWQMIEDILRDDPTTTFRVALCPVVSHFALPGETECRACAAKASGAGHVNPEM
jgi:hypothetical protein